MGQVGRKNWGKKKNSFSRHASSSYQYDSNPSSYVEIPNSTPAAAAAAESKPWNRKRGRRMLLKKKKKKIQHSSRESFLDPRRGSR